MAYPHLEWLDLQQNGVLTECAVMKKDPNGNIYHFSVASLDAIDKNRLRNILTGRNSANFPLWDLMQQVTLGNGVNALDYFHQLVKVQTPGGQIIDPVQGRIGAAGTVQTPQPTPAPTTPTVTQVNENATNVGSVDTRTPSEKRAATMAAKKAAEGKAK